MSVTLGQAVLYLLGDRKGLDETLGGAEQDTKSWASNLGSNVNKLVSGALIAGGTAVVAGIAAVGGIAVSTANQVAEAQGKIQTQLGLSDYEAHQFGQTIKDVYANNFGESIEDVGAALETTAQNLGRVGVTAQEELGKATEYAIGLRDAFEVDVNQSTDAAAALMDHLGLSSQEAFDFITAGLQDTRINNEDFLDTITEYSNLYGEAGFSAEQFYSTLATGSQAGVLGTDKVADAVKEFGIRFNEQNDGLIESFDKLGLSYEDIKEQVDSGSITMAEAFGMVTDAVANSELPASDLNAAIAGLGTQFEDLGATAVGEIDLISASMADMEGATDGLNAQYNNLGSFLEGLKRRVQIGLEPMGRTILNIANMALPYLQRGLDYLLPIIEQIGRIASMSFGEFFLVLQEGGTVFEAFLGLVDQLLYEFGATDEQITAVKETITTLWAKIQEGAAPIIDLITQFVSWKDVLIVLGGFIAATVIPIIAGLIGSILAIAAPIVAAIAIVALLRNAWEQNWGGIRDKVEAVINFIKPFIESAITAIQAFWAENGDSILAKARETWEAIQTKITEVMTAIKERISFYLELVKTIFAAFRSAFEGDWTAFGATLRQAWDMIWEDVKNKFNEKKAQVIEIARQLTEGIRNKFTSIDWGELGTQIITGIANAIRNGAGAIADAAKAAAEAALAAAKAFLGIESPSKVAGEEIGDPFVAGIAKRIAAGVKQLKDAAVVTVKGALTGAASVATEGAAVGNVRPLTPAFAGAGSSGGTNYYDIKIIVNKAAATAQDIAAEVDKVLAKVARSADVKIRTRSR